MVFMGGGVGVVQYVSATPPPPELEATIITTNKLYNTHYPKSLIQL